MMYIVIYRCTYFQFKFTAPLHYFYLKCLIFVLCETGSLDLDNHSLGDESSVNSTEPSSVNPTNTNTNSHTNNTHNRRSSHNPTHGSSSNANNNAQNKARGKSRGISPTRELFQRIHNSLGHGENSSVGSDGSSTRNEKRRRRRKKEKEQILPDEGTYCVVDCMYACI